jgi:RimJ/RimL family protein N-acetyltransferase
MAAIVRAESVEIFAGAAIHWSIRTLATGELVGCCDLSGIDRRRRSAEIGFMLSRGGWREGYALEALQAVVGFAGSQGLRRLSAQAHLGNRRSEDLLQRLGFGEKALLRRLLRDGERRDSRLFGLLL